MPTSSIVNSFEGEAEVTFWACFAVSGPLWLVIIDGAMNSGSYKLLLGKSQDVHV